MTREEMLKTAKPILFNTDMVRAILDGRKTATRRVIKPRYKANEQEFFIETYAGNLFLCYGDEDGEETRRVKAPYQVGDILYVRETWQYSYNLDENEQTVENTGHYVYAADGEPYNVWIDVRGNRRYSIIWRPSIHMPKEAARIFLRVTDVRVERLYDIDEIGVINEGAEPLIRCPHEHAEYFSDGAEMCWNVLPCAVECDQPYPKLFGEVVWNSTIKNSDLDKYGWDANPWVYVIEFETLSKGG